MGYLNEALRHLQYLARHFSEYDEEYIIRIILLEIGLPSRGAGCDYAVDAILLYYQENMRFLTKEIYPAVAKKYGIYVRSAQVEGAIRKAIESAYSHRDQVWACYFPEKRKPTNAEFIARMAKMLDIWKGCCAAEEKTKGGVTCE